MKMACFHALQPLTAQDEQDDVKSSYPAQLYLQPVSDSSLSEPEGSPLQLLE